MLGLRLGAASVAWPPACLPACCTFLLTCLPPDLPHIACCHTQNTIAGVVTLPFSVREGINIFLAGFVPTENLRFRDETLTFKVGRIQGWQIERGPASAGSELPGLPLAF